jgi:hypothetical protein
MGSHPADLNRRREPVKSSIVAALVAALAVTAVLATPAQAATPKERKLARQVKTLKAQNTTLKNRVKTLTGANTTLTNERNALAADKTALAAQVATLNGQVSTRQLATAQQGAIPAIGTMSESDLYFTVLPVIRDVFLGGSGRYTYDFFSSGSDYSSRSFTYCGFC